MMTMAAMALIGMNLKIGVSQYRVTPTMGATSRLFNPAGGLS